MLPFPQPSSSGRAAELLARDGGTSPGTSGFIGFGTMSGDLGYVPAAQSLSQESDQDSALEADFRMALRKLTKRDVITKLKVHNSSVQHRPKGSSTRVFIIIKR